MPFLPFSSPIPEEGWHVGHITSDYSERNEAVEQQMLHGGVPNGAPNGGGNNRHEYHLEPASPSAADYYPMLDVVVEQEEGQQEEEIRYEMHSGDQEFQDCRGEDTSKEVEQEFPHHHLTYVCYPMRAPDRLRRGRNDAAGDGGGLGTNKFLRPPVPGREGIDEDFPDGLKLIFVSWLKKYDHDVPTGVTVGLWRTAGEPGSEPMFVVVKRLKGWSEQLLRNPALLLPSRVRTAHEGDVPGELAFCDLPGPETLQFRFLFSPHLTSLPQTHAFQLNGWPGENVTHFGKYYNGQTVEKFIDMYKTAQEPIPEAMIWHVIAQVGRAFKFIHTGRTMPDKTQPRGSVRGPPNEGEEEREWIDKEEERAANWTPTAHYDAHAANVWLHFVTQYERDHDGDRCLEHFDDCFPQVILGDFGLAVNENSRAGHIWFGMNDCPNLPDRETWKDKAEFGLMLHHLLLAGRKDVPKFTTGAIPENWAEHFGGWLRDHYSWELIDVVKRFSYLARLADRGRMAEIGFHNVMRPEYERWQDGWTFDLAPCNDWFHNSMIDLADREVDKRRESREGVDSVRWATGQRMSNMPYQVPNRTKYSQKMRRLNPENSEGAIQVFAVPVDGKETLRSKARTIYNRKLRRPITGAFYRHPPDPPDRVDKDKLWVSKTYRLERIRYRKHQAIRIESDLKNQFTPPPTPREVEDVERRMFEDPWESRMLRWDSDDEDEDKEEE